MTERCPLLRSEYEGRSVPAWDTAIPETCRGCFSNALTNPNVQQVHVGFVVDASLFESGPGENQDYWRAEGLRVLTACGGGEAQREGIIESGIDTNGDNESHMTDRTTFTFNCLNT